MSITLVGTAEIATMLGLSREHVTDYLIKQPGFPKPAVNMSQKLRRWDRDDVMSYVRKPRKARRATQS